VAGLVVRIHKPKRKCPQCLDYEFHTSGGIGDKDEVKIVRVGTEEAEKS
jgi:uncharacterized protein (UPF0179 family)